MVPIKWLEWGAAGQASFDGPAVPEGKAWIIRACGIATDDGNPVEWMMQIRLPEPLLWLVPVERNQAPTSGTPVLACSRQFVMLAGERLSPRANGLRADKKMALVYAGWEIEASDVERYVLGASATTQAPPPPVDFSAFATAMTNAAQALEAVVTTIP